MRSPATQAVVRRSSAGASVARSGARHRVDVLRRNPRQRAVRGTAVSVGTMITFVMVRRRGRLSPAVGLAPTAPCWAERLVAESGVGPGDLVVDIGAGRGVITDCLLEPRRPVIAVERHPQRAAELRPLRAHVVVVAADAATSGSRAGRSTSSPTRRSPSRAPLLRRLLHPGSRLRRARLVLDERADRPVGELVGAGRRPLAGCVRDRRRASVCHGAPSTHPRPCAAGCSRCGAVGE